MTSTLDQIWFPLSLSLWIAFISSLLVLFSGVVIAYIFTRFNFRGKELAELLVTLPLAKKGIFAGLVLSFARAIGEFGATLMLAGNIPGKTNTMSISIYSAFQAGNGEFARMLVLILIFRSLLTISLTGKFVEKLEV